MRRCLAPQIPCVWKRSSENMPKRVLRSSVAQNGNAGKPSNYVAYRRLQEGNKVKTRPIIYYFSKLFEWLRLTPFLKIAALVTKGWMLQGEGRGNDPEAAIRCRDRNCSDVCQPVLKKKGASNFRHWRLHGWFGRLISRTIRENRNRIRFAFCLALTPQILKPFKGKSSG